MHERHAAETDGATAKAEVVCDARLRKVVRNSQIYANYVWTRPAAALAELRAPGEEIQIVTEFWKPKRYFHISDASSDVHVAVI